MVDPTNLNPRFFRSLLIWSDKSVLAGTSAMEPQVFCLGTPSTYRQR